LLEGTPLCGGVKVVFEQSEALQERGHHVEIVSKDVRPDWYDLHVPFKQVDEFRPSSLPECDFVIGTFWTTISAAVQAERGRPVHLCQGYEGDTAAYASSLHAIETVYRLPILTLTVHGPLTHLLWRRFGKKAYTVGQGIDHRVFFPQKTQMAGSTPRVLVVGPYEIDWKGVHDGITALKALKGEVSLTVVRASQLPCAQVEHEFGATDEYHYRLRASEMAALYRSCHALLAPSWPQEGFGLPVLEAIACGVPVVVSDIPAFRGFATERDWALFFAERDVMGMQREMRRLLTNPALHLQLRLRGLEVAQEFRFSKVAERIEQTLSHGDTV
jgi:glycosyltransferase involved in cell wall biosynthesis